ncbi:hypothetical protein ACUH95_01510 [Dermabacteraceae bacterium P13101]|nr:hypothetical protein [Dermabacteraceae bacterium TAE3-ERU5]
MIDYTPYWFPVDLAGPLLWGCLALAALAVAGGVGLLCAGCDRKDRTVRALAVLAVFSLVGASAFWGLKWLAVDHARQVFATYNAVPDDPESTPIKPGPYEGPYMLTYTHPETGKQTRLFCGIRMVAPMDGEGSKLRVPCWQGEMHNGKSVKPKEFGEKLR